MLSVGDTKHTFQEQKVVARLDQLIFCHLRDTGTIFWQYWLAPGSFRPIGGSISAQHNLHHGKLVTLDFCWEFSVHCTVDPSEQCLDSDGPDHLDIETYKQMSL